MDYPVSDSNARLVGGKFTDGDPVNAVPPSKNSAVYQNAIHDELLNVIAGGGLTPDEAQLNQVFLAIQSIATSITAQAISDLVGGAPGALDTLNELAAALADDADYAATITAALATKATTTALSDEATARASADTTLQNNINGKAPTSHNHSSSSITSITPVVAGSAIAGLSAGDVGTYALLWDSVARTTAPGINRIGSELRWGNTGDADNGGYGASDVAPTGTWQCCGYAGAINAGIYDANQNAWRTTLWLRIS